jgi:Ca-activated chloride channel family protein
MNRYYYYILFLVILSSGVASGQHTPQQQLPEKTRLLFLLDGSGSMLEVWGKANQTKMDAAKTILTKLIDSLKQNTNLELALRVYGHRYSQSSNNCKDTYLEVPFKVNNHQEIIDKLASIRPKGVTPMTYALEHAANDFPANAGYRNMVILITDGIESCGGDLCATSLALQKKGVFLRPYIIGLGLRSEQTMSCAGKYIDAETPLAFHDILNEAIETSFAKTTVSVELLDDRSLPTETNINVSFVNNSTGVAMYNFVHYRNALGKTDSVQIDPVVDYDVIVYTTPTVILKNAQIKNGKHNVIKIPVPQGDLVIQQEGRKDLQAVVRVAGKTEIIQTHQSQESFRYLSGRYEVETLTLPRRIYPVEIQANKTRSITVPGPGIVNFNTTTTGFGSLYEIRADGSQQWVCSLDNRPATFTLTLLPGNYKVVFRAKNAGGSQFTGIKDFQLKTGETINLKVF